jgi:SPP1 family predicted phage head-tail adaptor
MNGIASRLKERVTLEQRVTTADEFGGQQLSWEPIAVVFAEVEALTGQSRERNVGDQSRPLAGYRVRIRQRNDVTAAMRLQWKERLLSIHAVHTVGTMMELLTYEESV